jgi:hypothetical protein
MNTWIPAALLHTALLSLVSATASADPAVVLYPETAPPMVASLKACAAAASKESHASRLDVVRYVEHVGRGNYEYWINATEPMKTKSYCRTQQDGIAAFRSFDGNWASSKPGRPQDVDQIVSSCAQLCRTDNIAPTNVGANLNNPVR